MQVGGGSGRKKLQFGDESGRKNLQDYLLFAIIDVSME